MKTCSKCNATKELTEYSKRTISKDGLMPHCKVCDRQNVKKWRLNNPEKKTEQNKNYWRNNTDKVKAIIAKWNNRISGVYAIYENNLCLYVGESKRVPSRLAQHKCNINNPSATSKWDQPLYYKLQQHSNLEFRVIEETPNHKEQEKYWINKLKPKYNA